MSLTEKVLLLKRHSAKVREAMLALPAWVTPNGVTVFRALLVFPVAVCLDLRMYWLSLFVLSFALLLDFVDGALAEAREMRSETGAFLDPLADKILVGVPLLMLSANLHWAFAVQAVGIVLVGLVLTGVRIRKMLRPVAGVTVAATSAGKVKMIAETVGLLLLVFSRAWPSMTLAWIAFAVLVVAFAYGVASLYSQLPKSPTP